MDAQHPLGSNPAEATLDKMAYERIGTRQSEQEQKSYSIHLLDQDSQVLLGLFEILSGSGYQVSASSNVDDALAFISRRPPEILIASGELRDMCAADLLDHMKYLAPSTRLILMGGQMTLAPEYKLLAPGTPIVISKPITADTILGAVRRRMDPSMPQPATQALTGPQRRSTF